MKAYSYVSRSLPCPGTPSSVRNENVLNILLPSRRKRQLYERQVSPSLFSDTLTCDYHLKSRRSVGYEPKFRVPVGSRIFSSPRRPHRLWYWGLFPTGQSGRGVKLTTRLQLMQRSRKRGSINRLPHTSWTSA
jgi:hypothetical protein